MKNKLVVLIVVQAILICILGMVVIKPKIQVLRSQMQEEQVIKEMFEQKVDLSQYESLEDDPDAWYSRYHFIAHSGGRIDGKLYSNSLEAWEKSYSAGVRIIDADITTTSDNYLIIRHGWGDNLEQTEEHIDASLSKKNRFNVLSYPISDVVRLDYSTYVSKKIYQKYTPMDVKTMLAFMNEHKDVFVACDMKGDPVEGYRRLLDEVNKYGTLELLDRIIVSFYNYEDLQKIKEVYPFKNWMIRQYQNSPHNYSELIEFCLNNNIHAVCVQADYCEPTMMKLMREKGLHITLACVDFITEMKTFYEMGACGAVSNDLVEEDWEYVIK